MATQISNQASLSYQYGASTRQALSNIATTLVQDSITADKSSLDTSYRPGDELTYMLNFTNNTGTALTNVSVVDDLATYTIGETTAVTPLTYVGPSYLYINGAFSSTLTPTVGANSLTYAIPSIPANANAMILYKATVNGNALPQTGSDITNEATFTADGVVEALTATNALPVEDFADVSIIKSMTPNPVVDGGTITYTFNLYNYGNTEATNVVLSDTFTPAPTNLTVSLNGVPVSATDYNFAGSVLTLPASGSSLVVTVPAATYTQDIATGAVNTNPGVTTVTITGRI